MLVLKQIVCPNKIIICFSFLPRRVQLHVNRVTKVWRHKIEISEIMGFVRIFWKKNVQEAYLPKMSIWGQIVSEIVAQLCLENSTQTLLNFFVSTRKKLEAFVWTFLSITG